MHAMHAATKDKHPHDSTHTTHDTHEHDLRDTIQEAEEYRHKKNSFRLLSPSPLLQSI